MSARIRLSSGLVVRRAEPWESLVAAAVGAWERAVALCYSSRAGPPGW